MSTHNLCFRAKKKEKNVYPCTPQFHYIKVGCKGVFITRTCLHDASILLLWITCNYLVSAWRLFPLPFGAWDRLFYWAQCAVKLLN